MTPNIVVIGSSNTDMVIKSTHLPQPGETVLGGQFLTAPGGKGANQAVAAARLDGRVAFIAGIGTDTFGNQALQNFYKEGIDSSGIMQIKDCPSGIALIMVDKNAENIISVAPGANARLSPEMINQNQHLITSAKIVLMQLEIPLETVAHAVRIAQQGNALIILNPAPAQKLPPELLNSIDILTPNATEAGFLTNKIVNDEASATIAAQNLHLQGVQTVIITLGHNGALLSSAENGTELIPAFPAKPQDTTAAGDAFNGALAVALAENKPLQTAVQFANAAASITVTRMGAQPSLPQRDEIEKIWQHY